MNDRQYPYAQYPYTCTYPSTYPCVYPNPNMIPASDAAMLQSMQHMQYVQQQTLQALLHMQRQLADMQSVVTHMSQNRQPSNTYIHNEFEKFEIFLDAIDLETLSGSMQIGLFNGSAPTSALPPTITTTNITAQGSQAGAQAPALSPHPGIAPVPDITPAPGVTPTPGAAPVPGEEFNLGSLLPGSGIPQGISIPPGLPLPSGATLTPETLPTFPAPEPASVIIPPGATFIPPGMTAPPGSVEIAPGIAVLPPGTMPIPAGSEAR
ncbi:hypothetical protein [Paenibacillus sp. LHD-38]|uniref:hypothetical protein n=1 Tax=Paenibacillus sp. LHD-38 TaxID=3072143 RepID=UPI00280CE387|nr:hypothetical protein [Paenibacillus sp. LHD-38]MDQ8739143.1 hypothetical protein [Paenibacillus sp. LHD-38]